jgi:two-component system cell cycle response regulator
MNILVADDDLAIRSLVGELLRDEGHNVMLAEDGEDALEKYKEEWHEIVFSDIRMPKLTGIELLGKIKKLNELTQFIIMTSHASVDNSIEALKKGAFDYILKPFDDLDVVIDAANRAKANLSAIREQRYLLNTLSRQNEELGTLNKKFRELAIRDGLTGLYNHRHGRGRLREEVDRARKFRRKLSLLFIDLDHFKHFNDAHGHQAGDEVLHSLGKLMSGVARDSDTVARWGGEEFIIIAPETDKKQACKLAELIRIQVAEFAFPHADKQPLGHLSLSVGVATLANGIERAEDLLGLADKAVYKAKESGRNRTVFCRSEEDMEDISPAA